MYSFEYMLLLSRRISLATIRSGWLSLHRNET